MGELIELVKGILFLLIFFGIPGLPVVLVMIASGRRFARLDPLRAVAAAPGRRLLGQSGLLSADDAVRFTQGPHTLSLSRRGRVRIPMRRVTELRMSLSPPPPRGFWFRACTPEWQAQDEPKLESTGRALVKLTPDEGAKERFSVMTASETRARRLMNGRMRLALRQLDELFNEPGGYVGTDGRLMVVGKLSARTDTVSMEGFHRIATTILDELLEAFGAPSLVGGLDAGLPRIPAPPSRPLLPAGVEQPLRPGEIALLSVGATAEGSVCGVCGVEVGIEGRACSACGVRQHDDCWAYNGGCATYGCRGRASTAPPGASRPDR